MHSRTPCLDVDVDIDVDVDADADADMLFNMVLVFLLLISILLFLLLIRVHRSLLGACRMSSAHTRRLHLLWAGAAVHSTSSCEQGQV